jgi:type I restriction enzyme S subunit
MRWRGIGGANDNGRSPPHRVDEGSLDLSTVRHIAPEDFPAWTKRVIPQHRDVVFTYEARLHRYALIPEGF